MVCSVYGDFRRPEGAPFERLTSELSSCLVELEMHEDKTYEQLVAEIHELRERLAYARRDKAEELSATQPESISNDYLRTILETMPDGFLVVNAQGRVLDANEAYSRMSGYSQTELLSLRISDVGPIEEPSEAEARLRRILEKGSETFATRHRRKDGSVFDVEMSIYYLETGGGCFVCFCRDITDCKLTEHTLAEREQRFQFLCVFQNIIEHRRAEQRLRESEQCFRSLFDNCPVAYQSLDIEGRFIDVNRKLCTLLGYSRNELMGMSFGQFWSKDIRESFPRRFENFRREGTVCGELALVKKDGREISVAQEGCIQRDIDGNFVRAHCILVDITERKLTGEALRENRAQLDLALRSADMGVWRWDIAANKHYVDDQGCHLLGIKPAAFTGTPEEFIGAVHPDDLESINAALARTLEQDALYVAEYRVVWPDGSVHYVTTRGGLVRDDSGRPLSINGILWNITESKQTEDALRKSEERFLLAMEAAKDGIWDWNLDTDHVYYSPAYVTMLGYEPGEVPADSSTWADRIHPEDKDAALEANVDCIENRCDDFAVEFRMQTKNGEWRWILGRGKAVHRNANGRAVRMVGTHTDITESKLAEAEKINMERRLRKLEKAESLSRMAGSIAHHFNNKLGAVLGNLELALYDLPEEAGVRASIVKSMKAAHEAADVSQMMLVYLGQTTGRNEPIDLVDTIRESLRLSWVSIPRHVLLKTDYPPLRAIIHGNNDQIKQLLANLVSNAVEAIGQNDGDITVAIRVTQRAEIKGLRFFPIDWEPKAEQYVCLSVSDTGCGMNLSTIEKVFDPYFSTKFAGRGLGLSVLLGLVRAHDGAITVRSNPGQGADFSVFFPLQALEALPPLEEVPLASGQMEKGGLVLLVDDDPELRDMAEAMLELMGYAVLAASGGAEAVKLFKEDPDGVRFVITDLTMPGMDGWETLTALRNIRPNVPVVLASGYDAAYAMGRDYADQPDVFLHKPYSIGEVRSAINKALQVVRH